MRSSVVSLARAAGALALLAAPLAAQRAPSRSSAHAPVADFTPYAGYMTFQPYLDGPLGTNVRGAAAPVVGGQLAMAVSQSLSLVGNVAFSRGDLEIGLPILGGLDVGNRQSWLYDAAIEARLPSATSSAISPFLQLGAGAISTRLSSAGVTTSSTNPAAVAGAGVDLSLGGTLGLRAMVKDYVGRYKSDEVAGMSVKSEIGHNLAATVGLRLSF